MQSTKYKVHPADLVQDRDIVLALWRQAFPAPAQHPVKFDWCYGATPQGIGRLYLLGYENAAQVIGVQGIVPRLWWVNGDIKPAGICADLVVDQHHRSIGPALALVRQVIGLEQHNAQVCMLYGFPNLKSEALYRRAGYSKMGDIIRFARPLRMKVWLTRKGLPKTLAAWIGKFIDLAYQLRLQVAHLRAGRRWRLVPVSQFDQRFDALWSRVARQAGPMVMRNRDFLQWRFGNNFAGQTQTMVLETHNAQIDGYVVYVIGEDNMVNVLDFLAVDDGVALLALFTRFARAMYRQGCAGIMLEFSGRPAVDACLRRIGFSARETHPVYAVLGHDEIGWQAGRVPYFTYCDRDQ